MKLENKCGRDQVVCKALATADRILYDREKRRVWESTSGVRTPKGLIWL